MKQITLDDIAGLATEKTAWRLLHDLAAEWKTGALRDITPGQVAVKGDRFELSRDHDVDPQDIAAYQAPERVAVEASEVWTLGLLAFHAIMGTDILEHQGGQAQTPSTLIPRIGQTHCGQELSDLIYSCLNHDPSKRPSMSHICSAATSALEKPAPLPKRLTGDTGKAYASSLVSFWPEEIAVIVLALLFTLLPHRAMAQDEPVIPAEMQTLVTHCLMLRQPDNVSRVSHDLQRDNQWTLMDEIAIDRQGECTVKDAVNTFGLNDIGFRIFKRHSGVTNQGGRFRDGRDPRYCYSFIEVTVKRQATVSYDITGREGSQLLAIVPHDSNARFTATVTRDGKSCGKVTTRDGVCYLDIKEKLRPGDHFKLSIKNLSGRNMAFAIINYNSRK